MAYQPFYIAGLKSGLVQNPEAFLIPQDAFPALENAYIWRDRIKRKLGYQILGRLTRVLGGESLGNSAADPWTFNIFTILGITAAVETNKNIIPGTVTIVSGANTYTEAAIPDGILTGAPGGSGTINYQTGAVTISGMGVGVATTITFTYAPTIPVMGIGNRELSSINLEELIVFDQVYAYRYNTVTDIFEEWIPGTTWTGTNADFFWTVTYWQDENNRDLFWATNFNTTGAGDPIRYANGVTWTDFAPAVGDECINDEFLGTVTTPWTSFGPVVITNTPITPNSVVVTIGNPAETVVSVLTDDGDGNLTTTTQDRSDSGTIDYTTGSLSLTIDPALTEDTEVHIEYCYGAFFLQQAKILIPFKDRLLAFNTYEGETFAGAVQFPQRLRYSQNGDPTDQFDGWRSDIPGRGGFIDAPTSEHIVSVAELRDILIVSFERSTWQVRYTGNQILPFVWERIDTEYGSDATFSTVQFDKGVLQVGRDALTVCNGNNVERIDLQIPDEVGEFVSVNSGNIRVQGLRDINEQLVYWTFNSNGNNTFPDKLLVYNYLNGSYSIWNDGFTALGRWYKDILIRWQDLTMAWQNWPNPWDWANRQQNFPEVIGGNQHGFVEIFNQTVVNDVSLTITAIAGTTATTITSPNHNLQNGQIVRLRAIIGDSGMTDLNDEFYQVSNATANDFIILKWNGAVFTDVVPGSSYLGGGTIEVCNNFSASSKLFNIYESGMKTMLGYIDFLCDTTSNGEFTCQIFVSENDSIAINTGAFKVGSDSTNFVNSVVPTTPQQFAIQNANKYWQRFYCQTDGTTYQYNLTLSDLQMIDANIYESMVTVHALILWIAPGGRLI